MKSEDFLNYLTAQPFYLGQMAHIEHIPPIPASYGELERPLPQALGDILKNRGMLPLYRHQAEAVNAARHGEHVIISTRSASGKTLGYSIPVLESLTRSKLNRALYLYPTKALARDQMRSLEALSVPGIASSLELAILDGDTPYEERAGIRKNARIILSNPDMLHVGILPNHRLWSRFLGNLRFVVVDEAHVYRGVFGSHVSETLRRLRRLAALYGASPQFILASATIANPGEHASRLTGLPFTVVDSDGSPHGGKDFVFWNPPVVDKARDARRSANGEATDLFTELVKKNIRTLTFARTRRLTELIYSYSRNKLTETARELADRIKPYRAGYLPELRREIEKALFAGELTGVVATSALELGIDIGDLEATVLTGYPGSIASAWQQAGRSGRGRGDSLSFLIAFDNPLDQYFMRHPDAFFGKNFENALVNPDNPYIRRAHLAAAAWEWPLGESDKEYFGAGFRKEVAELEKQGVLRARKGRWYLSPSLSSPAPDIRVRGTSGERFTVWDTATSALLETVEANVAFFQIYPGAIYLHQGESYLITALDLKTRTAYASPKEALYYTETKELTDIRILSEIKSRHFGEVKVSLGEVAVTTTISGFKKKKHYTEEVIGEVPLNLPPINFETVGLWFELPQEAALKIMEGGLDFAGGLHALEHAAIAILPLFALCDRNDIGGVSTPRHPDTGKAQVFIYDAYPGGVGIAEKGYELMDSLWRATLQVVTECPCADGCPSCIQSPKCGNNNEPLDKEAAEILLKALTAGLSSR